jgi:triacylglycerol lipase
MRSDLKCKRVLIVLFLAVGLVVCSHSHGGDRGRWPAIRSQHGQECVILLHGLCRTSRSMLKIKTRIENKGYTVFNVNYPSRQKSIEEIAATHVAEIVDTCRAKGFTRIHFVTHSLGGIVVRCYLQNHTLPAGSRVVMLAPPNQGSELIDAFLAHAPRLCVIGGKAAQQLAVESKTLLDRLKPVSAEIGVIAGNRSWNPFFSYVLPGDDDGKVTVERSRLAEMKDFLVLPTNHTMILYDDEVACQILGFLKQGRFSHDAKNI